MYRKVASSSLSWLVAHFQIFRRLMKRKFDAYVLWPLAKKFQNFIVDQSTARDFTVFKYCSFVLLTLVLLWAVCMIKVPPSQQGSFFLPQLPMYYSNTSMYNSQRFFFKAFIKVIHPKYYRHLKKELTKAIWADKKWAGFWQISQYIK